MLLTARADAYNYASRVTSVDGAGGGARGFGFVSRTPGGLSGPRLPALRPVAASLLDGEGFDLRSQARPEVSADKRNAPHEIAASEPEVQKSPVARQVVPRSDERRD